MSFYHLPHPWNPGYAIPKYVLAEPPGRGAFVTAMLPRGTISALVPDYLAKPGQKLLGRKDADLGSLSGHCLDKPTLSPANGLGETLRAGGRDYTLESLGGVDPVASYGQQVASYLMARIQRVPHDKRREALRAVLDYVDPTLWNRIDADAQRLQAAGIEPKAALEQAIAAAFSAGITREVVEAGERALREQGKKDVRGQLALASYDPLNALSGVWSSIKGAASEVKDFAGDAVSFIGGKACDLTNNQIGQAAIAATATIAGAPPPATAAGITVAQAVCNRGGKKKAKPAAVMTAPAPAPAPAPASLAFLPLRARAGATPPKQSGTPRWLLPAGAVAAVAAFYYLRTK